MMKMMRSVLAIVLLLWLNFAIAQQPKTTEKTIQSGELVWLDWNEGYEKAVKSGKILLVDAYTDWCGWCKKMDRDTYSKPEIIQKINASFIPVKFNPEITDRSYKIGTESFSGSQLYGFLTQGNSTGFPTTYYIFPAKKRIMLDAGYKGPEDFAKVLDQIVLEGKK